MISEAHKSTHKHFSFKKASLCGLILIIVFIFLVLTHGGPGCCSHSHQISLIVSNYNASSKLSNIGHGHAHLDFNDKANGRQGNGDVLRKNPQYEKSSDREYRSKDYLRSREIMRNKSRMITEAPLTRPLEDKVQCKLLLSGDKLESQRVRQILSGESHFSPIYDHGIIEKTKDCSSYREISGFYEKAQSGEEENFPLAFIIRMHKKVTMVEKLLRTIYHPQNIYCIHVDKKSPSVVHRAMSAIASCLPNVFVTKRNIDFVYASFSAVEADMICMEELLNSSINWKYLLNMAGSEFPLKTNLELVKVLKMLNGTNDIEQVVWSRRFNDRINSSAVIDHRRNLAVPTNTPKAAFHKNITLMKGCSYNTFSRAFIEWVFADSLANEFINWTRDTIAPDETVWSTLNNLPKAPGGYHVQVTQTSKTFLSREVIWMWSSSYCWEQKFVRGICILSSPDLHWLSNRWEFFANKFDLMYDHYAVDCLAEWLRNRTVYPDPEKYIHRDIISNFPHVKKALGKSV